MGNRFVLGEAVYLTKALGGGRFDVVDRGNRRVGSFAIKAGVVEADDAGVEESRPTATVAARWVGENLSAPLVVKDLGAPQPEVVAEPPPPPHSSHAAPEEAAAPQADPAIAPGAPSAADGLAGAASAASGAPDVAGEGVCRILLHKAPDEAALLRAKRHMTWLRTQPGVVTAHLTLDPNAARAISVVVFASRDAMANMRYAQPPADAAPLDPVRVEQLNVVG